MSTIFGVDGSGGGKHVSGFGVVVHTESGIRFNYKGIILPKNVLSAKLANKTLEYTYGNKTEKTSNNRGELSAILLAVLLARDMGLTNIKW